MLAALLQNHKLAANDLATNALFHVPRSFKKQIPSFQLRITTAIFFFSALLANAKVTTEVYWRMGERGYAKDCTPIDSSGYRRQCRETTAIPPCTIASNNPAPGSTHYTVFDGTNYCWAIGDPERTRWIPPTNNVGFECWVKPLRLDQGLRHVVGLEQDTSLMDIAYDSTNGFFGRLPAVAVVGKIKPANTNDWLHLALVRAGGVTTFYTNGVAAAATNCGIKPMWTYGSGWLTTMIAGNQRANYTEGFACELDEVRFFHFNAGAFSVNDLMIRATNQPPQICGILRAPNDPQDGTGIVHASRENLILKAEAAGKSPLTWLWFKDAALFSTAPEAVCVTNAGLTDAGSYQLVVTNSLGAATSQVAVVVVKDLITASPGATPNAAQQAYMDMKFGIVFTYGPNTFMTNYPTHDWGNDGTQPASIYHPTNLDVASWVALAHDAGAGYVMCVTKHHDGFCLWPSAHTDYDVANPLSGDHTDVVGAMAEAANRHGLAFAIYYSLWDRHEPSYRTNFYPGYFAYVTNQLTELLTQYGPVREVWFDGGWAYGAHSTEWHMPEIYDVIKRLQPDCLVVVNAGIGVADSTNNVETWQTIAHPSKIASNGFPQRVFPQDGWSADATGVPLQEYKLYSWANTGTNLYYLYFEDWVTCLSSGLWFWHEWAQELHTPKWMTNTLAKAIASGNVLLFNIPPDTRGQMTESTRRTLMNFKTNAGLSSVIKPALGLSLSGERVVCNWSTNAAGYTLEWTTNLPAAGWISNSIPPAAVNSRYTLTNLMSGPRMFYRLRKP